MPHIDPDKLKNLLGQSLSYRGVPCQVIEILADEPALVLRGAQERKIIQSSQYGDASGWGAETFTVAILDNRHHGLNPELPELAAFDLLA